MQSDYWYTACGCRIKGRFKKNTGKDIMQKILTLIWSAACVIALVLLAVNIVLWISISPGYFLLIVALFTSVTFIGVAVYSIYIYSTYKGKI